MKEAEWLAANDPTPMLRFLEGKASDRKLRLFACASCRRIWHLLTDDRSRFAVEVAERYADGFASEQELTTAGELALQAKQNAVRSRQKSNYTTPEMFMRCAAAAWLVTDAKQSSTGIAIAIIAACSIAALNPASSLGSMATVKAVCSAQLLDIFGSLPFRSISADPSWHTSTVLSLARGIYDIRAFDRLPILADALQDAGCENADILDHCRGPGPHARGCWVVDLVLGKV